MSDDGVTELDAVRDMFWQIVGRRIRNARKFAGLTQEQLGMTCDLSRASIGNLEAGRQKPDAFTLDVIAKVLDVDINDLLPTDVVLGNGDIASRRASATVGYLERRRDKLKAALAALDAELNE